MRAWRCWQVRNPFVFKYVRQLRHDRVDDSGPCVLLATPSMLQVLPPTHYIRSPNRKLCSGLRQQAFSHTPICSPCDASHPEASLKLYDWQCTRAAHA